MAACRARRPRPSRGPETNLRVVTSSCPAWSWSVVAWSWSLLRDVPSAAEGTGHGQHQSGQPDTPAPLVFEPEENTMIFWSHQSALKVRDTTLCGILPNTGLSLPPPAPERVRGHSSPQEEGSSPPGRSRCRNFGSRRTRGRWRGRCLQAR